MRAGVRRGPTPDGASGAAGNPHVTSHGRENREAVAGLRVVAVMDSAALSGPARQLTALVPALARYGITLHVITFVRAGVRTRAFVEHLADSGVSHDVIPDAGPFDVRVVQQLRGRLRVLRPDLVQTHGYKAAVLARMLRLIGDRWPWIAFFHGATDENAKVRLYNWLDERASRRADEVVCMTARQVSRGRNRHERVIYNAVLDLGRAPDPVFDRRLKETSVPRPTLLVLGRLSPEKGVDVFLRAMQQFVEGGSTAGAIVVGDGPERDRLVALAAKLSLTKYVAFLPATSDVIAAYEMCDAVVIPSRSEGLPNVLLEALAQDRAVLATDVGAIREVLGETTAGLIVPPDSPDALARGITSLLAMRDDALASVDRRMLAERFSVAHRAEAHVQLYGDVLHRVRRIPPER